MVVQFFPLKQYRGTAFVATFSGLRGKNPDSAVPEENIRVRIHPNPLRRFRSGQHIRQKAVCILLTLLHLGIKNIRLGPTLPAFVSPNVLNFLVEKFNIAPITTPEEDLKAILG